MAIWMIVYLAIFAYIPCKFRCVARDVRILTFAYICIICDSQCWKVCNSPPSQLRSELHDVTERIAWEPKSHWSHLGWKDRFSSGPSQHVKAIKDRCHFPMHARPQDMQQELMVPSQSSKKPASHPSSLHSMVHSRLVGMETLLRICVSIFLPKKSYTIDGNQQQPHRLQSFGRGSIVVVKMTLFTPLR